MRCKLAVSLVLILTYLASTQAAAASQLQLVAAQSLNAPATFTATETVTYDANNIYLASSEGNLYVKSRNTSGFPLVGKIQVGLEPLYAVRVDKACHTVYVTGRELYKFSNLSPFAPQGAMPFSPYGLESLFVDQCTSTNPGFVFLGEGDAHLPG